MPRRKRIKIGTYKKVFSGKVFTIFRSSSQLPDGGKKIFEFAIREPYVGIFAFDKNKKLLITKEYRPKLGKSIWRIPIGGVEKNETPKEAASRELREEIGFRPRTLKFFMKNTRSETFVYNASFYVAKDLVFDPLEINSGEDITVIPTPIHEAYDMALQSGVFSDYISLGIIRLFHKIKKNGFHYLWK